MRYPQVLIYENDGRIAEFFRRDRDARKKEKQPRHWSIREPRSLLACLRLVRRGSPSVLILKVGTDVVLELTLLERMTWLYPEADVVVVGDTENPVLAGLAWDLGARYVLLPCFSLHELLEIVAGLMETTIRALRAAREQKAKSKTPVPEAENS
jgi:hypothetical protein